MATGTGADGSPKPQVDSPFRKMNYWEPRILEDQLPTSSAAPKVAFDHRTFLAQKHGGISRYIVRLIQNLKEFGVDPVLVAPLHINDYVRQLPRRSVIGRRTPVSSYSRLLQRVDRALHAPLVTLSGANIVHETYFAPHRIAPKKTALALTMYDMIFELFPELFPHDLTPVYKAAAIARADHIFCISENTRQDLIRFYPEAAGKCSVTLLGVDHEVFASAVPYRAPRPYILYVGLRHLYKNFEALLNAYAASSAMRAGFDLLCAGGGPLSPSETERVAELGLTGKVVQHDADDRTLASFYRGASAFVYPSLYEGFGIPPLEAMAAGCPVVTIHSSSIPEVCGDAAEYAQPGDLHGLGQAIERVLFDAERGTALRKAGAERARAFSWERCASETSKGYRLIS